MVQHERVGALARAAGTTASASAGAGACARTDGAWGLIRVAAAFLLAALVAGQQLDNLLTHARQVRAELRQHLCGNAVTLTDKSEQEELRADILVPHLQALAQGQLEDLLGARGKRNVAGVRLAALADDLFYLTAHVLQGNTHGL